MFSWELSKRKFKMADSKKQHFSKSPILNFFFEKQKKKWPTQKNWVFQNRQFSIFFVKILWIGNWVSGIEWCEGHWCGLTYMAVRLSNISSKSAWQHKKCIFSVFELISDSLMAIWVEPHQCPLHQSILIIQGPILEIFTKKY